MLTIYAGPMFSGKSTNLIAEAAIAEEEGKKVVAIKPLIDERYSKQDIVTHDGNSFLKETQIEVRLVDLKYVFRPQDFSCFDLVLVDEVQFFENAENVISLSQDHEIDVVCSGLDLDSSGKPFGKMPLLLSYADAVYKCHGVCAVCNKPSTRSLRKTKENNLQIFVGGSESYESRCFEHWKLEQP